MALAPSPLARRRAGLVAAGIVVAAGALGAVLASQRETRAPGPASVAPSAASAAPAASLAPAPARPAAPLAPGRAVTPEITDVEGEDLELHVFSFRVAAVRFDVVDLGMSRDVEGALDRSAASLAINGGYFAPSTAAEGLVMVAGKTLSAFDPALGGGVVVVRGGRAELLDASGFAAPEGADFAIQARPRLVVGGAVNLHGDDGRKAERTALCVSEDGRRIEAVLAHGKGRTKSGPTLTELAEMLVSRGCEGALNLDGGPSTGAAWRGEARVEALRPRAAIRHAITLRLDP